MLPFKSILCGIDFNAASYSALAAANELALHFSADLWVVHVLTPVPAPAAGGSVLAPTPGLDVPLYEKELLESSKKSLEELIKEYVSREITVVHPRVVLGSPAEQIVALAEEEDVDLIVIATHGRTGWQRLVLGSVAERVVRTASNCPVLIVTPPEETR